MTYNFSQYDDTNGWAARAWERLASGAPRTFDRGWLAHRRSAADDTALGVIVDLARGHGHPEVIVWGPTLVRAVLAGDEAGHRGRTLEERHRIVDVLRRLVHHNHTELGLEPAWFAATLEAIDECRGPFLAGARSAAQIEHDRRLDAVRGLAGGENPSELDLTPLPPEELDLTAVRGDLHERLRMLDGLLCVAVADLTPGIDELLTAARRLLRRAALGDPDMFARPSSDPNLAAGVAGAVAAGNGIPDARNRVCQALGIRPGSGTQRIPGVLRAAGTRLAPPPHPLPQAASAAWADYRSVIADPALQTCHTRRLLDEAHALIRGEAIEPPDLRLVVGSGGEE